MTNVSSYNVSFETYLSPLSLETVFLPKLHAQREPDCYTCRVMSLRGPLLLLLLPLLPLPPLLLLCACQYLRRCRQIPF